MDGRRRHRAHQQFRESNKASKHDQRRHDSSRIDACSPHSNLSDARSRREDERVVKSEKSDKSDKNDKSNRSWRSDKERN